MAGKDNLAFNMRNRTAGSNCGSVFFRLGFCCHNRKGQREHVEEVENDEIWGMMCREAKTIAQSEPVLASRIQSTILAHCSLEHSLAFLLSNKLSSGSLTKANLYNVFLDAMEGDRDVVEAVRADLHAVRQRDPACVSYVHCMLDFKGFQACQSYRITHTLWKQGRISLALAIQSRISEVFSVDIHPGATIGKGILLDHAIGVVIGETSIVGNNVAILHHVTLGGTGKDIGDRHPKVGNGVLIGAGAIILGNITIGDDAKIGAGAVVFFNVPPSTTAVGNPARLIGGKKNPTIHNYMASDTMDHTSFYTQWSDYVI